MILAVCFDWFSNQGGSQVIKNHSPGEIWSIIFRTILSFLQFMGYKASVCVCCKNRSDPARTAHLRVHIAMHCLGEILWTGDTK